jgi:N-formylglutamate deformylase
MFENMLTESFLLKDSPVFALAIHSGHQVRNELLPFYELNDEMRLREEDPSTDYWAMSAENRLIVHQSRFEVDLNRPRDKAFYLKPQDAWGLNIWKAEPSQKLISQSLAFYDYVYSQVDQYCKKMQSKFKHFVIFDLHSYNHRRSGPDREPADPLTNPEINLGTGTMLTKKWSKLVNQFTDDLMKFNFEGRRLDVRENIKFYGGNLAKTIHENYPESACVLSIEVKKIYMDEWTGKLDKNRVELFFNALKSTIPGLISNLKQL